MSWAKVDDRANEHRKILAAGLEASALWVWGLCYANRQPARDGFIPAVVVPMLYPLSAKQQKALPAKLIEVGLWERVEGGYQIHDYHPLNPTKEQYEASLAGGRSRAAKSYESRKLKNPVSSPEEELKKPVSSGVEWSGVGSGSDLATTGSTLPDNARGAELQKMALTWVQDPNRAALQHPSPHKWPEMLALTALVAEVFGGPNQPPRNAGDPRTRAMLALLAEGRTAEELLQAVRGAGKDRNYRENPAYQTLQTILRDSAQVDKFIRLLTVSPAVPIAPVLSRGAAQLDRQLARVRALEAEATQEPKALP